MLQKGLTKILNPKAENCVKKVNLLVFKKRKEENQLKSSYN